MKYNYSTLSNQQLAQLVHAYSPRSSISKAALKELIARNIHLKQRLSHLLTVDLIKTYQDVGTPMSIPVSNAVITITGSTVEVAISDTTSEAETQDYTGAAG